MSFIVAASFASPAATNKIKALLKMHWISVELMRRHFAVCACYLSFRFCTKINVEKCFSKQNGAEICGN
jgi:hypothetical protein